MWLKGTPGLIAVLLVAGWLGGCATSSVNGTDGASSSNELAPQSLMPAVASDAQPARGGGSVPQVSDPQAAQAVETLASMSKPGNRGYRIGPQDILDISVFQAPELSKTVEVADNGTIDLPLIGETPASGKTAHDLQRDLSSKLGAKYLQNPQVQVRVKEFNSNRVTVSGAVKSPGVFPYKGETLFQCVTMAGGLAPESNSMVLVLRTTDGKRSAAKFNLAQIQKGSADDPTVQPGDVIVADTNVVKQGIANIMKYLPLAGFAALL